MTTALTVTQPATAELYRQATDVAGVCREIVLKTVQNIQGKQYVKVEGWQSIATAHGCVASSKEVMKIEGGIRAIGEIRRADTGVVISTAEGFVGDDEKIWAGRPEYARRAMAQTRAISRACRSAFAHVVVLMDAGLSTTPAEEVPEGGFDDHPAPAPRAAAPAAKAAPATPRNVTPPRHAATASDAPWRRVIVPPFIKKYAGQTLGDMQNHDLLYWAQNYQPKEYKGAIQEKDLAFRAALDAALRDIQGVPEQAQTQAEITDAQASNTDKPVDDDVPF